MWIGERQIEGDPNPRPAREVYLLYTLKRVKAIKAKLGKPMMGMRTNILELDEEMLPEVILEGLCDANGGPLSPPITLADIEALGPSAYPHLMESFNHAWNGMMPEKKRTKLLELEKAAHPPDQQPAAVTATAEPASST